MTSVGGRSVSTLAFVPDASSAPPAEAGTRIVALDSAWTPAPGDRADLIPVRTLFGRAVEGADLYDGALAIVDDWAERTGAPDRLLVEGVTYWFRMRETMWRWVHERMLWRHTIAALELPTAPERVTVPEDETALTEVVDAMWPGRRPAAATSAPARGSTAPPSRPSPIRRLLRFGRRLLAPRGRPSTRDGSTATVAEERTRREALLDARIRAIVARPGRRVLVLTNPRTYQRIGLADRHLDPLFGAVIPRLAAAGLEVVRFGSYVDHRRDEGWAVTADDDGLIPQSILQTRWAAPEDEARGDRAVAALEPALDALAGSELDVDGVDLGPGFVAELGDTLRRLVRSDVLTLARVERLIAELDPAAVLLGQEGIRTPWLMSCRRTGVPVIAVQHGVLYPTHAGYPPRPHPALVLPSVTAVYGADEASVLLDRGAYRPDEVAVTGSPRVDLDTAEADTGVAAAERAAVRAELGVADGDRLLVLSSLNLRFVQRSHLTHSLARTLGGALPRVHLVFKLHPGEFDEGPYRALIEGLAKADGRPAPPISVVKDIDLYRLLRAADAHLGMLSTVLTDAVIAGTRNLIGMVDRHADLLGYVDAGVAWPVCDAADVLAALDRPWAPDPAARAAFLGRHARPGDASGRIVDLVTTAVAGRDR